MDNKYQIIKELIESGKIKSFPQIWEYVTVDEIEKDFGVNSDKLKIKLENVTTLKFDEIENLAKLFKVDREAFWKLIIDQVEG